MRFFIGVAFFLISFAAKAQTDYATEIRNWDSSRVRSLKSSNGWLNLVGLYWLKDGANSYGTAKDNDLVFPAGGATEHAGNIILKNGMVTLEDRILFHPDSSRAPVVSYNTFRWSIIKREDKYGIRLRDLNSSLVQHFNGIERYPADTTWRVKAYLQKGSGLVMITNVLGQTTAQESPGKLVFTIKGKTYILDAIKEGDQLFIIFGDETSAITTYGAGRFIYTSLPDASGYVTLDFNKAFNPPCAFTDFATCPLPPKQNILPIEVTAGEKDPHRH